jgi:AAA15 family ATPase/GTPase
MLTGIKIKNYKSFNEEGVDIQGLEQINIFIGKNNSGKSNILKFVDFLGKNREVLKPTNNLKEYPTIPNDYYGFDGKKIIEFSLFKNFDQEIIEKNELLKIYQNPYFATYEIRGTGDGAEFGLVNSFINNIDEISLRKYAVANLADHFRDMDKKKLEIGVTTTQRDIFNKPFKLEHIEFIRDFRELNNNDALIIKLSDLVNSTFEERDKKEKLKKIHNFISDILGVSTEIKIPNKGREANKLEIELILEKKEEKPISSIGTGVHEIIILGLYLMLLSEPCIVCIDEPELHLHPGLQRKFLKWIYENTKHQYFIATHSNAFLDCDIPKTVFNTKLVNDATTIEKCETSKAVCNILDDLGIRASEILQTNGIIWVEGPSDRIYIKKWLELARCEYKEGFHYSFQYYGGRVLSHYSVEADEFNEFINMLVINRNAFIVMDSDMEKDYQEDDLRDTKKRIINECEETDIGYWVSAGREIENYLGNKVLTEFAEEKIMKEKFGKIYNKDQDQGFCKKYKNKTRDSRKIVESMDKKELEDENNYDLGVKIGELKDKIGSWN